MTIFRRVPTLLRLPILLAASACATVPPNAEADARDVRSVKELREGRLDDAEAELRLALELDPDDPEAHANLGLVFARRGDLEAAVVELERALVLDRDLAAAYVTLGNVRLAQERAHDAEASYLAALRIQPELPEPRRNLVLLLLAARRDAEARAHAMRLVRLEPDRWESLSCLALAEIRLGRPEAALARVDAFEHDFGPTPGLSAVRAEALAARSPRNARNSPASAQIPGLDPGNRGRIP